MKTIGIIGRAYYNKDNQKIIQFNENIRKCLANYDVSILGILPTEDIYYVDSKDDQIAKEKLEHILALCDGFIAPGGTYWYNFDEYIMNYAIKNDKPLLCICLGFQALCSMNAITRDKFDMTKSLNNNNHYGKSDKYIHKVILNKKTKLYDIIKKDELSVNSVHHDIVDFPMENLVVSSKSDDGIIESVELPNKKFCIGIQWHPEYLMDEDSKKIFKAFVDSL